jgi:outer membrane protein TolC
LLTAETDLVNSDAALAASSQALASDQVTVFKALGGGWEQAPDIEALPIRDGRSGEDIAVK